MIENFPAWHNENFCEVKDIKFSVLDLGLIHCDATYEVISSKNGNIFMLDQHLERFEKSCRHWRLDHGKTNDELKDIIYELCKRTEVQDLLIWLGVTRGIPNSGSPRDLKNCKSNLFLYVKPYFGFNKSNSATVCISDQIRVPDFAIDQKYKNFAWNDLTMAQWEAIDRGYDTSILLSMSGYITEGPGFNVFFIKGDSVYTPKRNCLGGITILALESICRELDISFYRSDISKKDIPNFDYAAIASTAGNLVPVIKLDDIVYKENKLFSILQRSMELKLDEWSTRI